MILGHPLQQRRRQQERLLTITRNEVLGQARKSANPPGQHFSRQPRRDAAARRPADATGCIGKRGPVGDREADDPGLRNRVEACVEPRPAGTTSRTIRRVRAPLGKAGVRISIAASSSSLALSPKFSGAPAPYRATRATIALPESDRPDGREPAMPLPRKGASVRTDADDRFDDSRHQPPDARLPTAQAGFRHLGRGTRQPRRCGAARKPRPRTRTG